MRNSSLAVITMLLVLSVCSCSKPALQATWYFVQTEMYVAILNQDTRTIKVNRIILNRGAIADDQTKGWTPREYKGKPLDPGGLLFLKVSDFWLNDRKWEHQDCRVPVRVTLEVDEKKPFDAEMMGTMPSSVPEGWEKNCEPVSSCADRRDKDEH